MIPITPTGPVITLPPGSLGAKLKKAAHDLEAVFYGQLFQAMRATIPDGGLVPKDSGEKVFTSMLDDKFSDAAASQNGRGLAGALYRQLSQRISPEALAAPAALQARATVVPAVVPAATTATTTATAKGPND